MDNDHDTGERLRSLYAADGGAPGVFSQKVADYAASRPDYAAALFDLLASRCPPSVGGLVADVGAGTGLLTRDLLRRGYDVVAVEPSAAMRAEADRQLGASAGYRSVDGTAEAMPLAAASVDLVAAAQAFHWFDIERARAEFLRVLKPRGSVALIWNDRVFEDPLHVAFDELSARFGGARRGALLAHEDRAHVPRFFGAGRWEELAWPHAHRLDAAGFLALIFSRSYIPARDTPAGREVAAAAQAVFDRFATDGAVEVRYRTVLFFGRPA